MADQYHHKNLKADLIHTGLRLLSEEGYDNFSLRGVAKACGVSRAAPYCHFKNKDELVYEIASEVMHKFCEKLEIAMQSYPNDYKSQLREMGVCYVRFFLDNPSYLRIIFSSNIPFESWRKKNLPSHFKSLENPFQIFRKTIERIAENQGNAETDLNSDSLTLATWGLVHGIAVLLASKKFKFDDDVMEIVKKIMWSDHFFSI